jgi:hypothetical protein
VLTGPLADDGFWIAVRIEQAKRCVDVQEGFAQVAKVTFGLRDLASDCRASLAERGQCVFVAELVHAISFGRDDRQILVAYAP